VEGGRLSYLNEPRPWANKILATAHNGKAFDLHFIPNRAILVKWNPEFIMNGLKIMCINIENLVFLDSVSFLLCPLRKLSEAYGLTASKSWYPHYFNTERNLDYTCPIPEVKYYCENEMGEEERREFYAWYESQKSALFDNRRVLEKYFQDDVRVLRQMCRVFRCEFMQIGNLDVFLELVKIASDCYKMLRKRFLQPDTTGLVPTGWYTCNNKQSKKSLIWLLHMEETDGVKIMHCRNGREYRLSELPHCSVD